MANKNVKLKNKNGDYLYPYTDNIPTASTSAAGKVRLDSSPTSGSNNAITSGAVHTALSSKADDSLAAHKAGVETFTGNKTLQASNDDAWLIKKANGDYTDAAPSVQVAGAFRVVDKNNKIMGDLRVVRNTAGLQTTQLTARNAVTGSDVNCIIACYVDKDGNAYTYAPTPASNDSSNKIATTAWVNSKVSSATTSGLATCEVIVSKYNSGKTWYRVWSDGWIEQGGEAASGSSVTVTFPKAFAEMNYDVQATSIGTNGEIYAQCVKRNSASDMIIYNKGGSASLTKSWYACGY